MSKQGEPVREFYREQGRQEVKALQDLDPALKEFYIEQGRAQVRPAIKYAIDQGRLSMLEEIIESLEAGHSALSGAYRDGYDAALESILVKAKAWE